MLNLFVTHYVKFSAINKQFVIQFAGTFTAYLNTKFHIPRHSHCRFQ